MPFSVKWNQVPLEKLLIPGLQLGKYKMNLENLIMPESKKVAKEKIDTWQENVEASLKKLLLTKSGTI